MSVNTSDFLWLGNHPALDLLNTQPIVDGEQVELLGTIGEVLTWARLAGLSSDEDLPDLRGHAAAETLTFVHRLRDGLRTAVEAPRWTADALAPLNRVLGGATGALQVAPASGPAMVSLRTEGPAAQLRLDLAAAVVDIFRHDRGRIRQCSSPTCVLMFLDLSKSARRRWCDMAVCGNRAKAATHRERTKHSTNR